MDEHDEANILQVLIWDVLIPIAVIVGVVMGVTKAASMLKTLWVNGEPNKWVLIMRNGKMIKAGVGLKCFKGPFDQVATFPSKLYKV